MSYGQAYAQYCTASHPCAKICGDHVCAPGEVYPPVNQTTTVQASANVTSTNQTTTPGISTSVGIIASATAVKQPANMTMTTNATAGTSTNMTMTSANATTTTSAGTTTKIMMPREQVASGTQPKDVKCGSGLDLVINQFNSRPACVKADIASLLVARGWGMLASGSP